ncbi:MAG: hypothetical protein EAZ43_09240 [Betaproteobacteria bacterium]|nr:MAG: hypothetical protein EAZ43_09240 [Betaproteobacteria bacterium]
MLLINRKFRALDTNFKGDPIKQNCIVVGGFATQFALSEHTPTPISVRSFKDCAAQKAHRT